MTKTKARAVLTKCEADLRGLVAAAADSGDYDAVLRITSWAKQIASMLGAALGAAHVPGSGIDSSKKATERPSYPRFQRRGDYLVKIGWSKNGKSEYEHKARFQVALTLALTAADVGKDGRIFQINEILPLFDPNDESEIPTYQVYLVIAWWRSAGLLDQHGRQGYSIPNASQLHQAVETAWAKLLEK